MSIRLAPPPKPQTPTSELLAALRAAAARSEGRPLTPGRYTRLRGAGAPAVKSIYGRFGCWAAAMRLAGLR